MYSNHKSKNLFKKLTFGNFVCFSLFNPCPTTFWLLPSLKMMLWISPWPKDGYANTYSPPKVERNFLKFWNPSFRNYGFYYFFLFGSVIGFWVFEEQCRLPEELWIWLRNSTTWPKKICWKRFSSPRPIIIVFTGVVVIIVIPVTQFAEIQTCWRALSPHSYRRKKSPRGRCGSIRGGGPTTNGGRQFGKLVNTLNIIRITHSSHPATLIYCLWAVGGWGWRWIWMLRLVITLRM